MPEAEPGLSFQTLVFCSGRPLRTAPRDHQPPTAHRQPPTAANRQPLFNTISVVLCVAHVLTTKQIIGMELCDCSVPHNVTLTPAKVSHDGDGGLAPIYTVSLQGPPPPPVLH